MEKDDPRISELTATLQDMEQKLAQREKLLSTSINQTETVREQYTQAMERAETLRMRLEVKEERLSHLQSQLEKGVAEAAASRETMIARDKRITSLQKELERRNELIATLEQLCSDNDNTLSAIDQDLKRANLATPSDQLSALGLVLESLNDPGTRHRISRTTTTLGRAATNDIAFGSELVSRYHARIAIESDAVYFIDLQSTNGSKINGQRAGRLTLSDGDVIAIGDATFRFSVGAPAEMDESAMGDTFPLLDESVYMSAVPRSKIHSMQILDDPTESKK